ncbi:1965_t:CDS:2 [Paraglomus brasilianum]|uniref:1965_t:CDS:1 n=1 Tax=Paraglomus brasilianum TaxID=144538 RepID=A0A9N9ANU8_9GLOM|nr:1965_t:CDS:2 [Paraglomus brasilianum]
MLLDMHFADLHNEYYLSKLKVLDFSHDCCELSIIPDLHFFLKSGDELIVVKATMRRGFINLKLYSFKHKKKTQRFRNERYMSNYLLRGSYFMSVQDSSLLFDFKFGDGQTSWVRDMTHRQSFPTFRGIDISPHLSGQDSQNTIFFQWRTLESFLDSTSDLLQQGYLVNPVPERGVIIKRRRRDTMVGAKEEDKWIGMTSMDIVQDNYKPIATRIISSTRA